MMQVWSILIINEMEKSNHAARLRYFDVFCEHAHSYTP